MDRRTFLKQMSATPLIFGLGDLLGGPSLFRPDWYLAALERMKKTGRYGVVLVAPDAPAERLRMGKGIHALLEGPQSGPHEIFSESVVICMTPQIADRSVKASNEKANRILLDPTGKRVASDTISVDLFEKPAAFTSSFVEFLHGKQNARLRKQAKATEVSKDAEQAFRELDLDGIDRRDRAARTLLKHAEKIFAVLVYRRIHSKSDEVRDRLRMVMKDYYARMSTKSPGPRLPYGMYLPKFVHACGRLVEARKGWGEDTAIDCGMARSPKQARKFLRFLKD